MMSDSVVTSLKGIWSFDSPAGAFPPSIISQIFSNAFLQELYRSLPLSVALLLISFERSRTNFALSFQFGLSAAGYCPTAAVTDATPTERGTITYTITVINQGNVQSGVYTVTDTLPAGVSPTTLPAGATVDGSVVTWDGANLAPGETAPFTLVVQIDDVNQRPFRNVAEISADSAELVYGEVDIDSTPNDDPTDDNDGNGHDQIGMKSCDIFFADGGHSDGSLNWIRQVSIVIFTPFR